MVILSAPADLAAAWAQRDAARQVSVSEPADPRVVVVGREDHRAAESTAVDAEATESRDPAPPVRVSHRTSLGMR